MSMISEQVKGLIGLADDFENLEFNRFYDVILRAADTIESLSAKLETNTDMPDRYTVEQILDAITQADKEIAHCIEYRDRDGLENALRQYLGNMERSAEDCRKSVLKIDTPKVCIDCPCHFAGESGMVMCGVEKRELLSDDIETFKPDWCPLKGSEEDCGGWIYCKDRLPTMGECQKNDCRFILDDGNMRYQGIFDYIEKRFIHFNCNGAHTDKNAIRWHEFPEPYHEP